MMTRAAKEFSWGLAMHILAAAGLWCAAAADPTTREFVIAADTTIRQDMFVPPNAVLTIEPGVTLTFAGYHRLAVEGMLIARGTAERPIVFTASERPRGSTARPAWKGVEIIGAKAHARLSCCRIEGAYRNLVWDAYCRIDSCEFVGNHYALYCAKQAAPHIKNNRFYRNVNGVCVEAAAPLLLDNTITENVRGVCLRLSSESIIGRNRIEGNDTNIVREAAFGENAGALSLHYLWKLVNQLY